MIEKKERKRTMNACCVQKKHQCRCIIMIALLLLFCFILIYLIVRIMFWMFKKHGSLKKMCKPIFKRHWGTQATLFRVFLWFVLRKFIIEMKTNGSKETFFNRTRNSTLVCKGFSRDKREIQHLLDWLAIILIFALKNKI